MEGSSNANLQAAWPLIPSPEPPVPPIDAPVQGMGEMHGQGSGRCAKKVNTRRSKLSNFAPAEDVNLCTSWLAISCDPITNIGQRKEAFWVRVARLYETNRGPYPERSQKSLMSRWDYIKKQVSRFSSYMTDVLRVNPSGVSDADKTSEAAARFAAVEPRPFTVMHCWNVLKDEPKWMDVANKGLIGDSNAPTQHTPQDSTTVDQGGTADQSGGSTEKRPLGKSGGSTEKRPLGKDGAKEAKKKGANNAASAGSVEYASKFHDLSIQKLSFIKESDEDRRTKMARLLELEEERNVRMDRHRERQLALEERKVKLKEEEIERRRKAEERAEDERILGMDLEACTPALREYYQRLQGQILERLNR